MTTPDSWRQSTYSEIQRYYRDVFPDRINDLPDWITPNAPKQYALAFRTRYPAQSINPSEDIFEEDNNVPAKDFIRRSTRSDRNPEHKFIRDWDDLLAFLQQPASRDPMAIGTNRCQGLIDPYDSRVEQPEPVPAAAYYALDNWEQFWVLAFDIDAKDVAKQRIAADHQTYKDVTDEQVENSGIVHEPPTAHTLPPEKATGSPTGKGAAVAYPYEYSDIRKSLQYAFELRDWLLNNVGFDDVEVFYSGQGAHIYAFSDDPYYKYTHQARRFLVTYIRERMHIPVDEAVTWDKNRVMRLPYSLHSDVNRVVTPVKSPAFDFQNDALPPEEVLNQ